MFSSIYCGGFRVLPLFRRCPKRLFSTPTYQISSKTKQYSERRLLGYSMEQMFDVVATVERYKEFLPYCTSSEVAHRDGNSYKCQLAIGFQWINESYVSVVTVAKPHLVRSVCTEGKLFNHLLTTWRFRPGLPGTTNTCLLDFSVDFEFRNLTYSYVSNFFFDHIVVAMVNAFLHRARDLYGPETITAQKPKVLLYKK